jgi:hypothetical protein
MAVFARFVSCQTWCVGVPVHPLLNCFLKAAFPWEAAFCLLQTLFDLVLAKILGSDIYSALVEATRILLETAERGGIEATFGALRSSQWWV